MKNIRSPKNFLVNPTFQFRVAFYFVSSAVAVAGVILFLMYGYLNEIRSVLASTSGLSIDTQLHVDGLISKIVTVSTGLFAVMALGVLVYAVIVSHRIAGPMVAILAFIEQMKKGNYSAQRSLRPYDELAPIMSSLRELSDQLHQQTVPTSTSSKK
jgi:signal transduction histidine kinase